MIQKDTLLPLIEQALTDLPYPTKPAGLYEPISYTLSLGGKRIRPTLLLLSYALFADDVEKALPAALALEIYHNHTLLHDDLMDNAEVRRGKETVHRRWDANTAILSGDTMLILAVKKMQECDCERKDELMRLFTDTMREICEGQQYDMNFESRTDVAEKEYIEMIRLKTSVLLACAAKAGAIIADAPRQDADLLYHFGEQLGLAFQLQDDYLDCFGDPAVFGKKIGGDIMCGKKTFLLINALQRADEATRTELLRLIQVEELTAEEKVPAMLNIYRRLQIPELCRERIESIYSEVEKTFTQLSAALERKQPLWDLAEAMLNRKK